MMHLCEMVIFHGSVSLQEGNGYGSARMVDIGRSTHREDIPKDKEIQAKISKISIWF